MKKNFIVAVVFSSIASGVAFANDGKVDFTGQIIDATCQAVNSPASPLEVNLGKVAKSAFTGAGSKASATKFTLQLKDCPGTVSSATVKFDGISVGGDNSVLALTQESGVATGVGIQLSDDSNTILPLHTSSKAYPLQPDVTNSLDFVASYIAIDNTVTPGSANSTASFTINYN
jgi:major type 1 subunit fimbrin (pilin)